MSRDEPRALVAGLEPLSEHPIILGIFVVGTTTLSAVSAVIDAQRHHRA